ncbi:MarR family winged helix-turn-helix transcriptional regulator [Chrysiogenes arsenatis]|uniref:MarR family winged helix-turn-helix transcriptional regulator n=1 Tax=Chrysiogenes arsenatis TaxID=309797 RepID=UPI0004140FD9|nr:MarR family transcriptional regulator [Chrysiogenes arsenatis]
MKISTPLDLYWSMGLVLRDLRAIDEKLLKTFDVGPAQMRILHTISDHPQGLNLKEISRMIDVTPGNASRLVEKLSQKGWVDRSPSPISKREIVVRLTREGSRHLRKLAPLQQQEINSYIGKQLSPELIGQLKVILEAMEEDTAAS